MTKKGYQPTKIQKQLLESMIRFAKENGLEIKTISIPWNKQVHGDVSNFIRKIEKTHKDAANSNLIFGAGYNIYQQPNSPTYRAA